MYDYGACDKCELAVCVFDDRNLTPRQQDTKCPAVVVSQSNKPKTDYRQWRTSKLKIIQTALADRDSIPLADLPEMLNVPMELIRSWRYNFMEAEITRTAKQRGSLAHITHVSLTRINRSIGHQQTRRQERLEALRRLLAERGPLSVVDISEMLHIHPSVLYYWVGRHVVGRKRRIDHWDGKNKEVIFIERVI